MAWIPEVLGPILAAACHFLQVQFGVFCFIYLFIWVFFCVPFGRLSGGRFTPRLWYFLALSFPYWHVNLCLAILLCAFFLYSSCLPSFWAKRDTGCTTLFFIYLCQVFVFIAAWVQGAVLINGPSLPSKETFTAKFWFEFQKLARDPGLFLSHTGR